MTAVSKRPERTAWTRQSYGARCLVTPRVMGQSGVVQLRLIFVDGILTRDPRETLPVKLFREIVMRYSVRMFAVTVMRTLVAGANTPRKTAIVCTTLMLFSVFSENSAQAQSRTTLRNDFSFELLGKAVLYSFSYQRMVSPAVGLQAGLAALGGSAVDATIVFVPVGVKFYLVPKDGAPFLTGGIVGLTGSADSGPIETATYGYAGLGFEYRAIGGFLFRFSAYALIASGEFFIWPGLTFGYAF